MAESALVGLTGDAVEPLSVGVVLSPPEVVAFAEVAEGLGVVVFPV